ncbi:MAG: hypothetical protein AAFN74_20595, partial [Myxococcota bacterium]
KLGAPTLTINFDAGGHASPPVFETPRPEQPAGRILPAWDGDQKQDRQLRQRIANELPAWGIIDRRLDDAAKIAGAVENFE